MSVTTVTDRLASIQENSITGITAAFGLSEMPNSLKKSQLPAVVNLPGEAEYEPRGNDRQAVSRIYLMNFYFTPVESPSEIARQAVIAEPFPLRVQQAFANRPTLEGLQGVENSELAGDGGFAALAYGGVEYLGIQFQIQVIEIVEITYDDTA